MLDSKGSDVRTVPRVLRGTEQTAKILIVGPFAVGKTTLVKTMSDIRPLLTEELMTAASVTTDDTTGAPDKSTTTVAMDFGRLHLSDELVLYLFGAPGQTRFHHIFEDFARGALGALVLVDTRRLEDSFTPIDMLEKHGVPYTVAVNDFDDAPDHNDTALRDALDLLPQTPLVHCDARSHASVKHALVTLVRYLLARTPDPEPAV
ncbi:ATP/GTP-binding protein [Streptomyces sp. NPDC088124]|uniref:GTP-binding protein n=1 Tax=Streptomyces sp. NPDC088124 TaxID=3154654 RepID=UPI0034246D69